MPRESCPGLLLTLVSIFVGLCESFAAGGATSGTQQPQTQQQHPVCKPGLEFWSTERASCWPCTRCAPDFTLSPCAVHKDAICDSLELDYASGTPKWPSEAGEKAIIAKFWRLLETKERVSTVETGNLDQDRDDDEGSGDEKPVSYSASRESKVTSSWIFTQNLREFEKKWLISCRIISSYKFAAWFYHKLIWFRRDKLIFIRIED